MTQDDRRLVRGEDRRIAGSEDKRLADLEAALSRLARRVEKGFADIGDLVAERHETDEIARLHAEIHWRDQEIAQLRAGGGTAAQGTGRSNSIPKIYARTRRKVLVRLNENERTRRVLSRLPGGIGNMLRIEGDAGSGPPATALRPFDPHGTRPSDLAGEGRISIEKLCLIAEEVSGRRGARA